MAMGNDREPRRSVRCHGARRTGAVDETGDEGQAMPNAVTHSDTAGIRFLLDGKVMTVDAVAPTKSVLNFLREDLRPHGNEGGLRGRRLRRLHRGHRRAQRRLGDAENRQRLHPVRPGAGRQGALHRGGPAAAEWRSASRAAGDGRLPRLAMRILHPGFVMSLWALYLEHAGRRRVGPPVPRFAARSPEISAAAPGIGRSSMRPSACSTCRAYRFDREALRRQLRSIARDDFARL